MHSYIGIAVYFISKQKLHNAMLACSRSYPAVRRNSQLCWTNVPAW